MMNKKFRPCIHEAYILVEDNIFIKYSHHYITINSDKCYTKKLTGHEALILAWRTRGGFPQNSCLKWDLKDKMSWLCEDSENLEVRGGEPLQA